MTWDEYQQLPRIVAAGRGQVRVPQARQNDRPETLRGSARMQNYISPLKSQSRAHPPLLGQTADTLMRLSSYFLAAAACFS